MDPEVNHAVQEFVGLVLSGSLGGVIFAMALHNWKRFKHDWKRRNK